MHKQCIVQVQGLLSGVQQLSCWQQVRSIATQTPYCTSSGFAFRNAVVVMLATAYGPKPTFIQLLQH